MKSTTGFNSRQGWVFLSHHVQTCFGAHIAFYLVVQYLSFLRLKRPEQGVDHLFPYSVRTSLWRTALTLDLTKRCIRCNE